MVAANLKSETTELMQKRSAIEVQMDTIISRLSQPGGPGLSGNLVDSEWIKQLNEPLEVVDPIIELEKTRQWKGFELIPSENFTSSSVMEVVGSVMTNKYSEGYPGARYYGGNEAPLFGSRPWRRDDKNGHDVFYIGVCLSILLLR